MTAFDAREKAFEDKYAHDSEMQFKAQARRDRLFGEWLAGEMNLQADEVEAYAKSLVVADLEEEGDEDVLRKVEKDLAARSMEISRHRLEKKLAELMAVAKEQIMSEA